MKRLMRTKSTMLLTGLLGALGLALLAPAHAQRGGEDEESSLANRETRETPAMRERVYQPLSEAQACAEMQDFECAQRLLERVRQMEDKNSYETAVMWQFFAFIYFEQDNTQGAMTAYENLLMQPNLPLGLEQDSAYTLAQLYMQEERYEESLTMLDRWFSISESPGADAYAFRAQVYYQMQRYEDGIGPITTAIDIARERGREVQESWYQLLYVFHFEMENYPKVIETLHIMLPQWPKKDYLVQLAGMYGQEGEEQNQLALFETAYEMGWLDRGNEYTSLASMLLGADVPYQAARVLEEGFENNLIEETEQNWRMLATAWQQAQNDEEALEPLTEAARLSDEGDLYHRLALSYANLARWQECVDGAREALDRDLERTDDVQLTLGNCLVELEEYDAARTAFRAASRDERSRRTAQQWITYIDDTVARERQLQQALDELQAAGQ